MITFYITYIQHKSNSSDKDGLGYQSFLEIFWRLRLLAIRRTASSSISSILFLNPNGPESGGLFGGDYMVFRGNERGISRHQKSSIN